MRGAEVYCVMAKWSVELSWPGLGRAEGEGVARGDG